MIGWWFRDLFIDMNNTIYIVDRSNNRILMWFDGNVSSLQTRSGFNTYYSNSFFVTSEGDIYVDNGYSNGRIDKWSVNATNSSTAMYITTSCNALFVDLNNTLYCSASIFNQVVVKSLDDISTTPRTIAGTGCRGSASDRLADPQGIFVDINFNLYVADNGNNRIQLFLPGQLNATTVVGSGAPGTITLAWPTDVILDADGYLFIVDQLNHRIVGSGPTGFRCVAGCSGTSGSASNELNYPQTMAFDSHGNIFVVDSWNDRVQKFLLNADSCGM